MPAGGPPFRQMKIRVGAFGVTSPNDGGFFTSAIPAGSTSVTLQIETGSPRWIVGSPETVGSFSAVCYYFARKSGLPAGPFETAIR